MWTLWEESPCRAARFFVAPVALNRVTLARSTCMWQEGWSRKTGQMKTTKLKPWTSQEDRIRAFHFLDVPEWCETTVQEQSYGPDTLRAPQFSAWQFHSTVFLAVFPSPTSQDRCKDCRSHLIFWCQLQIAALTKLDIQGGQKWVALRLANSH